MNEQSELVYEFFKTFSRFEYALKKSGFHYGEGNAKANWENFSESIHANFDKKTSDNLEEAVNYLLNNPPNKQIIEDHELNWSDNPPDANTNTELILRYICRIRNNLFHGGKYRGRTLANPERTQRLLKSSIIILNYAKNLSQEVYEALAT